MVGWSGGRVVDSRSAKILVLLIAKLASGNSDQERAKRYFPSSLRYECEADSEYCFPGTSRSWTRGSETEGLVHLNHWAKMDAMGARGLPHDQVVRCWSAVELSLCEWRDGQEGGIGLVFFRFTTQKRYTHGWVWIERSSPSTWAGRGPRRSA